MKKKDRIMQEFVSTKEFAEICDFSQERIRQLIKKGILNAKIDGRDYKLPFIESIQRYCAYLESMAVNRNQSASDLRIRKLEADVLIAEAKAGIMKIREREVEERYIAAEMVKSMTADLINVICIESILLLGDDKLMKDLAEIDSAATISVLLHDAVCQILTRLSEYEFRLDDCDKHQETMQQFLVMYKDLNIPV